MKVTLTDAGRVMNSAEALAEALEGDVSGFSIDSRTVRPGDLFFAIKGEKLDGHDYVEAAFEKGAAAAVVDRKMAGRTMQVPDTLRALQDLAAWARSKWNGTVVGVTGSAGKTSTKDAIAELASVKMKVGRTIGNFNNHVGLPLSILRLPDDTQAAVLEVGMNHAGEIRALAEIAKPDIGVVTNIGYAHIENFDSINGIALAKRELIEALPAAGVAVLNADDEYARDFGKVHGGRTVLFGLSPDADVRAEDLHMTETGARFRVDSVQFESALAGVHGVRNILAGIAVAQLFGIATEDLREAVRGLAPGKMRGERFTYKGITILNDCYNSNPEAARSMLDVLRDIPARRKIAVLGEMLELGRWSENLHRDVGRYAVECGISVLVGIRGAARYMADAAIGAGLAETAAYFFEDPGNAGILLRDIAQEGDAILFKGSRGTRVERALEKFLE
jgi:UDP-N-acetylmuramoyl-tripeptide--D-alanyl-D-alanine ligase